MFGSRKKRATGIHIGDDALNVVEMSSSSREGAKIEGLVSLDLDTWPLAVRLSRDDVSAQLLETLRRSVNEYDLDFCATIFIPPTQPVCDMVFRRNPWYG